uniref:ADP-ribosyl cyclase/cyclic ADP-ribose hydrolase n=1 Tax=Cajanus cajan TaxID=3821 RepID=A0A151T389_CAJCA|nr:TMV resistance protein N [Cajanus cajan]
MSGSESYSSIVVSPPLIKHDVFLSFRGEDTRDNFISHLYAELCRKKIDTYIDNRLDRGEEISPALHNAIEDSMIYVLVFSEHYACSTWCLDELTKILECKKRYGRDVIPVFYKVDPSSVRNQRENYAEAFEKHEKRFKEKVHAWKAVLTEAAGLSGWDSQVTRPEYTLVAEIVKDILSKLNRSSICDLQGGIVGINNHIARIQNLLKLESPDIRIIGIWGMGGIGKTTIARHICHKFALQFCSSSLILNSQKEIEKHGVEHTRNKYSSELLEEEEHTSSGSRFLIKRLKRAKVLLIVDDVNNSDHLKDLIGGHDNFGPGSRIIVTSRDVQVLKNAEADEIYEVKEMDFQDSLKLFSLNAFKQNHPIETYMELSIKVLNYAKGIPLALKVLGSFLYGRTKEAWESALQKLKMSPKPEIFNVLKLSYDGLDEQQKDVFLDIACFYRGHEEIVVAEMLDSCGFCADIEMDVLKDRCLISILEGRIVMHDLIQEMGQKVVREQCGNNPEKCSRLWKVEEIYDVLSENKGSDAIQCIFLDICKIEEVHLHAKTFKSMSNMRVLHFYKSPDYYWKYSNVFLQSSIESLPGGLKILHWDDFPQAYLPQNFCPKHLVRLEMRHCKLEQLWERDQHLSKLKRLDLSESRELIRLPDLCLLPNIEEIILSDYVPWYHKFEEATNNINKVYDEMLREGLSSIFSTLNKLCWLDLSHCQSLTTLSFDLSEFKFLKRLYLRGCSNLRNFPQIKGRMENLAELILDKTAIQELPTSLCHLVGLEELSLHSCTRLEIIPSSIGSLTKLSKLGLTYCESLETLPSNIFKLKLTKLNLHGCSMLRTFPEILEPTKSFADINLTKTAIKELPSSFENLVGLRILRLIMCIDLESLPNSIVNLNLLSELDCSGCAKLTEIPSDIGRLSLLRKLSVQESGIVNLPQSIFHLSCLKSLDLSDCKNLQCIPQLPPFLKQLLAYDCPSIKRVMPNSRIQIPSDSKEGIFKFHLTNSQQLDPSARVNIVDVAWLKITDNAYRSVFFYFPGSEVPHWFPCRAEGHSVTINTDSLNLCNDDRIIGFALCFTFGLFDTDDFLGRYGYFNFGLKFESHDATHILPDNDELRSGLYWKGRKRIVDQDHTLLWKYNLESPGMSRMLSHAQSFTFEISIPRFFKSNVTVKECGVCPLYNK